MSIQDDLKPNEKFAENLKEEAQAEMNEELNEENEADDLDDNYDDSDLQYDRIRDDNSETLFEGVKELIKDLSELMYYRNRSEGLAKDLIKAILDELKLKIGNVENITPLFQNIDLIKREDKNEEI